jgi:hypothetical protein
VLSNNGFGRLPIGSRYVTVTIGPGVHGQKPVRRDR